MSDAQLAKQVARARLLAGLSLSEAAVAIGAKNKSLIYFYETVPSDPNHVNVDESQFKRFIRAYKRAGERKLRVQTRKIAKQNQSLAQLKKLIS